MVLKCLECNYKCGNIACLKYHYESCHKDKIDKCICGNITISAICANDFSPWGCSLKNESSSSSGSGSSSSSNSSSDSGSSSSSGSGSDSSYNTSSNSDPNPNYNSEVLIIEPASQIHEVVTPMVKHGRSPIREVVTPIRNCNKCNYIKPPTDFDESKYTCRSCTSAKVNCPYCASIVRYDGIRAHVKKQHPGVELTKGFSRNLSDRCNRFEDKTINPSWQSKTVSPLVNKQTEDLRICKTTPLSHFTDSCSCKYYDFVLFLINNGINIEKVKENINLLKSIDNLK